jgi:hypothetical protein
MDQITLTRKIEAANRQLLEINDYLMGVVDRGETYEAFKAVTSAILALENYLYPDYATGVDEDIFFDDGE